MRNPLGFLLLLMAGLIIFLVGFQAFWDVPGQVNGRAMLLTVLGVIALVSLMLGAVVCTWDPLCTAGVTLLVPGLFNLLVCISILSLKGSPAIYEQIDMHALDAFSNYWAGGLGLLLCVGGGLVLCLWSYSASRIGPAS